jgi:hypothetical protein
VSEDIGFGRPAPTAFVASRVSDAGREVVVSATVHPADCYTIRNGWAWAHLFVRHGISQEERPRHWVNVACISDYGSFGYCWTHIGEDWRAFLCGLDMHYAMQKFMGERFRVPLTGDEAQAKARGLVIDGRRRQGWSKAVARELWEAALRAEPYDGCAAFLRDWDSESAGLFYSHELWDGRWDKVNPQAEGFWSEVWPHFTQALADAREVTKGVSPGTTKPNAEPPLITPEIQHKDEGL